MLASMNLIPLYKVKEPYTKVKSGFGYQGVLLYDKETDKVQCHICGQMFARLAPHVKMHDKTSQEYKHEFGFSHYTALQGEEVRQRQVETMLQNLKDGKIKNIRYYKDRKNKRTTGKTWKNQMEYKNNLDICPEQMIKKVQVLATLLGRTPRAREFGRQPAVVGNFGTYRELIKQANLKPSKLYPIKWTQNSLLKELQDFKSKYNRDPMFKDCERGLLPALGNFRYHFKTWGEAKLAAGFVPAVNQFV